MTSRQSIIFDKNSHDENRTHSYSSLHFSWTKLMHEGRIR